MELVITTQSLWMALIIFSLRVGDMALDTIRVLFVVRGRKTIAWFLGAAQSSIFVLAISSVLANLDNPLNVVAYATGFATGNVVGMLIEDRLAVGHIHLTIMSPSRGVLLAEKLREAGYAVTEMAARGKNGMVSVLYCDVLRKNVQGAEKIVLETDPDAFVTAEDVRPRRHGFWRA